MGSNSLSKPKKYKNNKYLDSVRGGRCEVYGCGKSAEPHHVNGVLFQNAMSSKNDYLCVELCREHHQEAERFPRMFWITNNLEPRNVIIQNLINYIEEER